MSCVALIFFSFVIVMFFSRIAMPCNNTSHCLFNCSIVFLSLLSTSFLFFATPAYRLAICLKILYCNMSALEVEIDQRCTSFNNLWCLQGSGKYPESRKLDHLPGAGMHCVTSMCYLTWMEDTLREYLHAWRHLRSGRGHHSRIQGMQIKSRYTHTHINRWDCRLISGYEQRRDVAEPCRFTLTSAPYIGDTSAM